LIIQVQIGVLLTTAGFTIVHYGDDTPGPPYVVIKPGKDTLARGTDFLIIMHRAKGQQVKLNEDITLIINTLTPLLSETAEDFDPTVYAGNSDDSISREQSFLMVQKY
jgi:hypothetical protein